MANVQLDKIAKLENIVTITITSSHNHNHQLPSLQPFPHHYLRLLEQEFFQKFSIAASFISSTATAKFTAGAEASETNTVLCQPAVLVQGHAAMAGNGGDCCFLFLVSLK